MALHLSVRSARLTPSVLGALSAALSAALVTACCPDAETCGPSFIAVGRIDYPQTARTIEVDVCLAARCGTLIIDNQAAPGPEGPLRAKAGRVPPVEGVLYTSESSGHPRRMLDLRSDAPFAAEEQVAFQLLVRDPATGFDYTSVSQTVQFAETGCPKGDEEALTGCVWATADF